jgi:hypothetical protein
VIAEAIADSENTALTNLLGAYLRYHLDVLGLPDEMRYARDNDILAQVRERCIAERVKSARGGARHTP